LAFILYIVLRAYKVPFIFDESYTLFNFVCMPKKWCVMLRAYSYKVAFTFNEAYSFQDFVLIPKNWGFLSLLTPSANNHFLNTFLMIPFFVLFGFTEFALRLPSVLSYLIYLYAAYAISFRLKKIWLALACFLLLNLNLYLLDFFSLARGYGLAIAFMLLSYYYLLRCADKNAAGANRRDIVKVLLPAALSVLANLVYLYYFLTAVTILLVCHFYLFVKDENKLTLRTIARFFRFKQVPFILFNLILLLVIFLPETLIMHFWAGLISFGGNEGLWQNTFKSIIEGLLYGGQYFKGLIPLVGCVFGTTILFSVAMNIREALKGRIITDYLFPTIGVLLIAMLNLLQFKLLGTPFLAERTALIYYPFIILLFVYSLHHLICRGRIVRLAALCSIAFITGVLLFHFIRSMNFTSTRKWQYECHNRTILRDLECYIESHNIKKEKISLGVTWELYPGVYFYQKKYHFDWIRIDPIVDSLTSPKDYYCFWAGNPPAVVRVPAFELIKRYDDTKTVLARTK
jgi:hypothetical protein